MRKESEQILAVFRERGLRAGAHIAQYDFGSAIVWRDGYVREEPVRLGLGELLEGGYLVELGADFELTAKGEQEVHSLGDSEPCLEGEVRKFLDGAGVQLIKEYFDPGGSFSGRAFQTFAGGGDALGARNRFTSDDLVAVTMLEVSVPGLAALQILDEQAADLSGLLAEIPVDVDLWDVDAAVVDAASPAATLWSRLVGLDGVGWVTAHKLMARKRPRLLPVYDSVVMLALQPNDEAFWSSRSAVSWPTTP